MAKVFQSLELSNIPAYRNNISRRCSWRKVPRIVRLQHDAYRAFFNINKFAAITVFNCFFEKRNPTLLIKIGAPGWGTAVFFINAVPTTFT